MNDKLYIMKIITRCCNTFQLITVTLCIICDRECITKLL